MAGTSGGVLEELDGGGARRLRLRLTLFLSPAGATPPSSFLSPPELHASGDRRDGRREREQAGPQRFDGCSVEDRRRLTLASGFKRD